MHLSLVPKKNIKNEQDKEPKRVVLTKDEITGLQTCSPYSVADVVKGVKFVYNVVDICRFE